eukprot:CAMPEP_0169360742 /NCGR_PEP_ID=MMETSP1017-20121227/29960_1 /TAXON_ID=342587 /ORGANISM="Karlodinium micrum, Strain CCMP2283" /LENGTH=37 /DNA_ID= /DNA_START= /DNA_END= /DNA_ORIENTATION=
MHEPTDPVFIANGHPSPAATGATRQKGRRSMANCDII